MEITKSKGFIIKRSIFFTVLLVVVLFTAAQARAAFLVFDQMNYSVQQGQELNMDVYVGGLMPNQDLAGFDITIAQDQPLLLSFQGYQLGPELGDIAAGEAEDWSLGDLGNGEIQIAEISLLSDLSSQPDHFSLATLTFNADAVGTTMLDFSNSDWTDADGNSIPLCGTIPAAIQVEVAPVPAPGAMLLLAAGLAGIAAIRKIGS